MADGCNCCFNDFAYAHTLCSSFGHHVLGMYLFCFVSILSNFIMTVSVGTIYDGWCLSLQVTPLTFSEWKAVFWLSFPVSIITALAGALVS